MTIKRLTVCADDFAISRETSAVILRLLEDKRINATSCLVETESWPADAAALRALSERMGTLEVGLHLNLTERFAQSDAELVRPVAQWALGGQVSDEARARIRHALRRQWDRFVEAFGRAPDFLDGHQHVHLFSPMRAALFELIDEVGFKGWVRQCRSPALRWSVERVALDLMSARFVAQARARGVATNTGFGGLRAFHANENLALLWARDLKALGPGALLMVHPGAGGSPPGTESIDACRRDEAAALSAGLLSSILARQGWVLDRFPKGVTRLSDK